MITAYIRVSTEKQNVENQRNEIMQFAQSRNFAVDCWVAETVSGRTRKNERKLGPMLRRLKKGDTLIVTELSRLSRSLTDVMSIVGQLLDKQVSLYSTKDHYSFDDTINSKALCFAFGLVAEIERNLISARTREALALRRRQGVVLGRRPGTSPKLKLLTSRCVEIAPRLMRGESVASLCRCYGVSRSTFNKFRDACNV